MGQILLSVIAAAIIFAVFFSWFRVRRYGTGFSEELKGICTFTVGQSARKNANKAKILELLAEKGELSNSEIREALGVSPKTSVNYLDELEAEQKIEQIGDTGRNVRYRLIS